jgi:hypothetical protein
LATTVAMGTGLGGADLTHVVVAAALPSRPFAESAEAQTLEEQERTIGILEAFCYYCHHFLVDPAREPRAQRAAVAFLAELGFDPSRLDELPMGLFLDRDVMEACLEQAGFTPVEILRSGLTSDPRLSGRLVGPVRDRHGRIVSFWARHPRHDEAKYLLLHKEWHRQIPAIGLDMALTPVAGGHNHLILVESLLDAILLHARGLFNVAAIGGPAREFTSERWQQLSEIGVHRVTLLAPRHLADPPRLAAVLEHYFRALAAPALDVVRPEHWGSASGPGDLVRAQGTGPLHDIIQRKRIHAYQWKALALLAEHQDGRAWGDASRAGALEAAVDFHLAQAPRHRRDLNDQFWPPLMAVLLPEPPNVALWEEAEGSAETSVAEPVAESALPAAQPAAALAQPAARQPGKPGGHCELHRCEITDCFCFD